MNGRNFIRYIAVSFRAESSKVRGYRRLRVVRDVNPAVDVRRAAIVPYERRAFDTLIIPLAVVAEIAFLVEGHAARL